MHTLKMAWKHETLNGVVSCNLYRLELKRLCSVGNSALYVKYIENIFNVGFASGHDYEKLYRIAPYIMEPGLRFYCRIWTPNPPDPY